MVAALFERPVDTQLRQLAYMPALNPVGLLASVPAILKPAVAISAR